MTEFHVGDGNLIRRRKKVIYKDVPQFK